MYVVIQAVLLFKNKYIFVDIENIYITLYNILLDCLYK